MKTEHVERKEDHNITPFLHPKLQRRITYGWCKSEVDIERDWGAGHVSDGDIVVFKVLQRRTRTRRGARTRVTTMDMRVLRDHPARPRGWNRTRLRRG